MLIHYVCVCVLVIILSFFFIYLYTKVKHENAKGKTTSINIVLVVGVGIEHSRDGVVVASFDPSIICLLHYIYIYKYNVRTIQSRDILFEMLITLLQMCTRSG